MNLQVSVVLLFISLTGGYSLKCYSCISPTDSCGVNVTCPDGLNTCFSTTVGSATTKGCAPVCEPGTIEVLGVKMTTRCCNTDLCNAADGVYKGSFLLLVSPLLFYFLFQ
ncbi:muscarinic toxin 1-like [Pimephales promelas]|uniref:muscarinic toxin 1-like n=1 Tax=Pimephales promelas TaxID=90988 RepID=UPI001955D436|nr:muscarinic toxin 1-like [Pimephales promelas]KAG1960355.1 CD59 glycoprotein preproprotein [Pimephales promelas]